MSKLLATVAAVGFAALISAPGSASARPLTDVSMTNSDLIEVSSARRHHRVYRPYRVHRPYRYYGHRPYYRNYGYNRGYRSYGYNPYYRPYYRPGFSVGIGPLGFGFF